MVPGNLRFRDACGAVGAEAGKQDAGFYLGGGHLRLIVDPMKRTSVNGKRGAAVSVHAFDVGAHESERFHDPVHGAFLYGSVAGEHRREVSGRQDAGHEPHGGAAVSAV